MEPQLPPVDPTLEDQLVAYLDGELDAEDCRRIEDLLASNPAARLALQRLEKTWELLDALQGEPTGENFTRTTLEMVAVAAEGEVQEQAIRLPRRRRRHGLLIAGGILAAGVLGFFTLAVLAPDPNRQLLNDLPLLKNLDEYRQAENFDFLRLLKEKNLFLEAVPETPLPEKSDRRIYVEQLPPEQKAELARQQGRFADLGREEQQKLRVLENQLTADPQAAEYRRIMHNYYAWWKSLPFYDRAELSDLPPAERVKKIENLQKTDLALLDPKKLPPQDIAEIKRWADQTAQNRLRKILADWPEKERKEFLKQMETVQHPWMVLGALLHRGPGPNRPLRVGRPPLFEPGDLESLQEKLTSETRERFAQLPWREKFEILRRWLGYAFQFPRRPYPAHLSVDDRLAKFFEELPNDRREQLLNLPSDEMQSQLLRWYLDLRLGRPPQPAPRREDGRPGP